MPAKFAPLPGLGADEDAASVARAQADIAAGRGFEHAKVVERLKSWGTPDQRSVQPEWLA